MWMMGYNEGGEFNNMAADSFSGRKLRPLIPRPSAAAPINNTTSLSRIHGNDLLSFNNHLVAEQSKRLDQFNTQQVVVSSSSRWNPTPEQLHILEELYKRGTRTPSTDHIQHITAQLRRYGKIEGKNVFYWFQNHKARERQKRRRQLESAPSDKQQYFNGDAESGANRTGVEFEQNKNWVLPTKSSTLADQRSDSSIQRLSSAVKSDGWIQYEEGDQLQQHTRSLAERNSTCQMMELSFSPPPTNLLINPTSVTSTTTSPSTVRSMDPKLIHPQDLSIFIGPYREDLGRWISVSNCKEPKSREESQTLELFPLRSSECTDGKNCLREESDRSVGVMNVANVSTPCQFFEFLPLKN